MTILIDVAAEFTGKKAFKQAENSTEKLTKSAKNLAKTFGVAFGAAAVLGFAKASVKAAADDQKAQKQLALALKNVGLERDAANAESYIQRLQSEFGVVDDKLRPAYQKLAIATRDTTETQKLLNLSLDISAATGKDLESVTSALSKAFLGSNTALSKLGIGISKADLKTKSFNDITNQLADTFKNAAATSAATFSGSIAKLGVASQNVKEIIGTGIIDALTSLSNDKSVSNLATDMESVALYTADAIRGIGLLIAEIGKLPGGGILGNLLGFAKDTSLLTLISNLGKASRTAPKPFATGMSISGQTQVKTANAVAKATASTAKSQAKILADKKLAAAIDKANLALNQSSDVFNMDAIQLNAAMINQAQQLGQVTNSAQAIAITNDITRLKIKQDMLALQAAIASGDVAAIEAATNQLNKDLLILSALNNQKLTLVQIESLLKSLLPKDLINLANLNEALRLLGLINASKPAATGGTGTAASAAAVASTATQSTASQVASGALALNPLNLGNGADALYDATLAATATVVSAAQAAVTGSGQGIGNGAGQIPAGVNITVNTGIGDPNAIAETVNQVIQDAVDRGTLRGGAY